VMFDNVLSSIGHLQSGALRPLAVTSRTRLETLPDVPTVAETVPGYETGTWWGVGAPKGTPAEIVDKLNREINAALAEPKIKARFAELGAAPMIVTPEAYGKFLAAETEKWATAVKFSGASVD
jgi:tripartite-type tricarboxylate transporter receptor subunit TctC